MSIINTIIIKDNKLYRYDCHYRFLLNLMDKDFKNLNKCLSLIKNRSIKDSGYFLIDFDDKLIFSNQSCFSSTNLTEEIRRKLKKEFDFHEIF